MNPRPYDELLAARETHPMKEAGRDPKFHPQLCELYFAHGPAAITALRKIKAGAEHSNTPMTLGEIADIARDALDKFDRKNVT